MIKRAGKKIYEPLQPSHGERSAASGGAESNHPVEPQDGAVEAPRLPPSGTGQYWIYILSNDRLTTLYIGVTHSLSRRLWFHENTTRESFVQRYHLTRLIYYANYADPRDAIAREKQLKRWTRAKKVALIAKMNPGLVDLAAGLFGGDYRSETPPDSSTARLGRLRPLKALRSE